MHRTHGITARTASRRRAGRALAAAIASLSAAAIAATTVPALASPARPASAASPRPAATRTPAAEAAAARARLAAALAQPHPGTPEAVTHPASDTMSSSHRPSLHATRTGITNSSVVLSAPGVTGGVYGTDVSAYQPTPAWSSMYNAGERFVYIKTTEGTYYTSPDWGSQYTDSYNTGFIRGTYAFAIPDNSTGAAQADYFVAHGGGWSPDGKTLPGVLDIEYNPYGPECYGLTPSQMVAWVASFDNEYQSLVGRPPMIYTTANWWNTCTGGSSVGVNSPLVVANPNGSPDPLPGGWGVETIWQYTASDSFGQDGDWFNGSASRLEALALGGSSSPATTTTTTTTVPPTTATTLPTTTTTTTVPPTTTTTIPPTTTTTVPPTTTTTVPPPPAPVPAPSDTLAAGQHLTAGHSLVSGNGAYRLVMQADGNLVLYAGGRALWASNTMGDTGAFVAMQGDGNLVIYSGGLPRWSSRTSGTSHAIVQDDGNFVIYRNSGGATWCTRT